jgi:hypothetical protein
LGRGGGQAIRRWGPKNVVNVRKIAAISLNVVENLAGANACGIRVMLKISVIVVVKQHYARNS